MKKLLLMLLILVNCAKAQDTIRFRNGETVAVKVNEVGLTEIKYNRFDNVSGPQYVVEKNDIQLIKYSGGHIDSFKVVVSEKANVKPSTSQPIVQSGDQKIIVRGRKLIYNNKGLGESRLGKLVNAHPDNAKRNAMTKSLMEMKRHRTKQYVFGYVGLGVGVVAAYLGAISGLIALAGESVPPPLLGIVVVGGSVGITGAVISSIQKKKRNQKKMQIASIYNN